MEVNVYKNPMCFSRWSVSSKSHNSSRFNHIPSKEVIEQLNQRNKDLVETINNSKYKEELNIAIMHNYVDQFYLSMKL